MFFLYLATKFIRLKEREMTLLDVIKLCLEQRRFLQEYGVEFDKIYILVKKSTIVKVFISFVASKDSPLWYIDAKNAFLHDDLDKYIYIL